MELFSELLKGNYGLACEHKLTWIRIRAIAEVCSHLFAGLLPLPENPEVRLKRNLRKLPHVSGQRKRTTIATVKINIVQHPPPLHLHYRTKDFIFKVVH